MSTTADDIAAYIAEWVANAPPPPREAVAIFARTYRPLVEAGAATADLADAA